MGAYIYPEIDFVFRTQQLLKQYKQIHMNSNKIKNYNITLFLNCFVGLLIIPQQSNLDIIPNDELLPGIKKNGISPDDILVIKKIDRDNYRLVDEVKSFRSIAKHMRNSIAHNHFKVLAHRNLIDSIEFKDYKSTPPENENNMVALRTFDFTIKIEDLHLYLEMVSSKYLDSLAMAMKKDYKNFEDFREKDKNGKEYRDIDISINPHPNAT